MTTTLPLADIPTTRPTAASAPTTGLRTTIPATLHSEWIKVRSVRSTVLFTGLAATIGIGMSLILGTVVKEDPYEHLPFTIGNTFLVSSWLTTLFAMVAGTLLFTSEVQHGTLAGALTTRPSRALLVAAKACLATVLGLTMGAVGISGGLVGGMLSGMEAGDLSGALSGTAWALALTSLAPVIGLGVGLLVRHSAAAVTTVLVWALAVETLVRGMLPATVSRFLPFTAAHGLLGTRSAADTPETLAAALSNLGNVAVIAAWAAAGLIAGTALLRRQDV
ncbi:MAG: ABC transporter permease [Acidimicrobiia bacterium]